MQLTIQHSSLQVYDKDEQRRADCLKVFSTGSHIIAGTERFNSGLREAAKKNNYRLYLPKKGDGWVAVDRDIIAGDVKTKFHPVIGTSHEMKDPAHPHSAKGINQFSFDAVDNLGRIHILGGMHYLTKGQYPRQSQRHDRRCPIDHRQVNRLYAARAYELANFLAKGTDIVFLTADSNMLLHKDDPFFGSDATTCWEDVKRYPPTHGKHCIDYIARMDRDKRVGKALSKGTDTLPGLHLHSDHKTLKATYNVKPLKFK